MCRKILPKFVILMRVFSRTFLLPLHQENISYFFEVLNYFTTNVLLCNLSLDVVIHSIIGIFSQHLHVAKLFLQGMNSVNLSKKEISISR